ncbi:FGGY-family carbohydrate kinase [Stappia sp. F7233]|uniref:FGGY-family carbohydrate kinase n=1 Tax=Stappia albiluteola TaxID=2758565 RepID=A0A839AGJ4_9HYPH|nr:FGGY-family carbohydrate kinase [Stappia albiluteola]MBA5778054.1 FGGY-family carbohydrate kinase [Stappia albiluteola]
MARAYVCAVDVGTASARAGIFDDRGQLLSRAVHPITAYQPEAGHGEYDSEEIWRAVCAAVKAARAETGLSAGAIAGIGFDATCSLVVRGENLSGIGISASGGDRFDTIAWFDHRAIGEAEECTATGHRVLDYIGGVMSPEMQTPKLLWLKRNRPESWRAARHFFDLADYLTFRATGSTARSQCTLTSKWTYLAHDGGWQHDFFRGLGLDDMLAQGGLPDEAIPVGAPVGTLTAKAAEDLGLTEACRVASGLIDAFAGALGVIGGRDDDRLYSQLALIAGTSSCLMGFSPSPRHLAGVWGPYFGAALPGQWLFEAGQSATGALLDHVIRIHGGGLEPDAATHRRLAERIAKMRADPHADLGESLHVLPDFHGNRSPFAEPQARGVISGLALDSSFDGLCRLYWRTAVAIALGLRHILDHLAANGSGIDTLHIAGGHTRNPLITALYADATGLTVHQSETEDAVLAGTAMAAATACGLYANLPEACRAMQRPHRVIEPDMAARPAYDRDYAIFLRMHEHRREVEAMQLQLNQPAEALSDPLQPRDL